MRVLPSQPAMGDYDPLLDKSYRDTALGSDVVAWLAWLELGGAAPRTLDQYERESEANALQIRRLKLDTGKSSSSAARATRTASSR